MGHRKRKTARRHQRHHESGGHLRRTLSRNARMLSLCWRSGGWIKLSCRCCRPGDNLVRWRGISSPLAAALVAANVANNDAGQSSCRVRRVGISCDGTA